MSWFKGAVIVAKYSTNPSSNQKPCYQTLFSSELSLPKLAGFSMESRAHPSFSSLMIHQYAEPERNWFPKLHSLRRWKLGQWHLVYVTPLTTYSVHYICLICYSLFLQFSDKRWKLGCIIIHPLFPWPQGRNHTPKYLPFSWVLYERF